MSLNASTLESLRRVFNEGFSAHDIAEPLISFDGTTAAKDLKSFMQQRKLQVIGLRRHGLVVGYVELADLNGGKAEKWLRPFEPEQVVSHSASLAEVVTRLKDRQRILVSLLGHVGAIVSRTDLQKPPVRMWLFGMVTLIEMRFSRMIERHCPDESWQQFLSESRVRKAEQLLEERTRRNLEVGLLDCLQFSDKGQIVARYEPLRKMTQLPSRRRIEEVVKRIERLRNHLAHAQDILVNDWDTIVQLAENLDGLLAGPPGLHAEDDDVLPSAQETETK